ncbi:UNVERIFIED_CONTAM: hypothetical protein Sradi_3082300 [Sesamum radiatum]|uniref:Uncharacterized protein n=1 Tax=Sesamum radiatum TaxID=300843 RepID=A0AAW2RD95_SESRA
MVKFLVVKAPSAYNIILGRPGLNTFRAVASTYHMKLKFPTPDGIGEATGDERMARECYANTLKRSREKLGKNPMNEKGKRKLTEANYKAGDPPEDVSERTKTNRVEAVEELKIIDLSENGERTTKIGTSMRPSTEEQLIRFLKENQEVRLDHDRPAWDLTECHYSPTQRRSQRKTRETKKKDVWGGEEHRDKRRGR